ncbi:MAG TPA: hypothetical protein VG322_13790 [Candidatus Acidoferrales bacterium]|jgi:hypothetical protein|nr:hypothetical protein [Candidatus Acidoferrales bacterium]
MRHAILIVAAVFILTASARAQLHSSLPSVTVGSSSGQTVDAIAARIDDDILTESEVNELAAFQTLVDGRAKSRAELIQELADQWIVRGEAATTRYPEPTAKDVDAAYAQLLKQFASPDAFKTQCEAVGLSDQAVRRLLSQQLYLSRFLDFRFRPAAQVNDQQVAAYYKDNFVPQLEKRGNAVPPLEEVEDTIREVLVQRAISERSASWLDDTRERLHIDVMDDERTQENNAERTQVRPQAQGSGLQGSGSQGSGSEGSGH